MTRSIAAAAALMLAIIAAAGVQAQTRHHRERERAPAQADRPPPAVAVDKRDTVVTAPAAFAGKPYWLVLAQCGGIYFKLNLLYTDIAVHARVTKPDPKLNAEYTKKLNDAIKTATVFFNGAEHFLMNDRGMERIDAVLTYDPQSRATGDRLKTIDAALSAAKSCPALYQACQSSHPKSCNEPLPPVS